MDTTFSVQTTVTIQNVAGNRYTLTKAASFYGNLFETADRANLTISNLILDGNKENHDFSDSRNASLIQLSFGTLTIGTDCILQNNYSYDTGGALYLSVGTVNVEEDVLLSHNEALRGGGIYLAPSTILNIGGGKLAENQATQGGAIYNQLGTLYVSKGVIIQNQANIGGAIYEA